MLNEKEIRQIFNTKYKKEKLLNCFFLKGLNLYELIIDFDPEETDPHKKKTSQSFHCINKNGEFVLLSFDDYMDYIENDGEEIQIF